MTYTRKIILSILLALIFIPLYSQVGLASHTTCVEDGTEYCRIPEDWMDIFAQVDAPEESARQESPTLASDTNPNYRRLYQGLSIVLNENSENILTGRTREINEPESWWKAYFDNEIGFPPYRYQVHLWERSDYNENGCEWNVESVDGESVEYMTISGEEDSCGANGGPNPDDVYGPMISKDSPINGADEEGNLNNFELDTLTANVDVPSGSRIIIEIYKDSDRTQKLTDVSFESSDDISPGVTRSKVNVPNPPESSYGGSYYVSIELSRQDDADKPRFGGQIMLSRDYPDFRKSSLPYSIYPNSLTSLNTQMYDNYNSEYTDSGRWDKKTSITPRLDKSNYVDFSVNGNRDSEFVDTKDVIHNAYTEIVNIKKSIHTSNVFNTEGYELEDWSRIIPKEGKVQVIYDSGVDEKPKSQDNYEGPVSDGDLRWSYSYDKDDVKYYIEFGYEYIDYGSSGDKTSALISGSSSFEEETISQEIRSRPGKVKFDYNVDNLRDDISLFYARSDTSVTYHIDYEEAEVTYDEDGDKDVDWNNYEPRYRPEKVTYNTNSNREGTTLSGDESNLRDVSKNLILPGDRTFEDDDFRISRLYSSSSSDRILFNRSTEDKELEETRWTQLYGTSVSEKSSVSISSSYEQSAKSKIYIPKVRKVSDGLSELSTTDGGRLGLDYAIDGTIEEQKVTLDAYISGFSSASDIIEVYVDDQKAGELTIPFSGENTDGYEVVTDIDTISGDDKLDISDEAQGQSTIDVKFKYKGSDLGEESVRVDFVLNIETGEKISNFNSRWGYSTFRDARFDAIYEHTDSCEEDNNCYDYSIHGIPVADNKINNGDTRGFPDEGGLPSSVQLMEGGHKGYPSGVMPVQAYLVPTTDTLITQRSYQANTVFPPIATETKESGEKLLDRYINDLEEIADGGEPPHYLDTYKVSSPMKSTLCAEGPVPNDDDDWRHYCDLYSGYLANNTVESDIVKTPVGSGQWSDKYGNYDLRDVDGGVDEIEDGRPNPIGISRYIQHSKYKSLRNETTSEYTELNSFESVLTKSAGSWKISGDATWNTKDVNIVGEKYIIHSTNLNAQRIRNPREKLSDEKIDDLESSLVEHQILSEDDSDDLSQFKIRFEDKYGNPISIKDRKFKQDNFDQSVEKIEVKNSGEPTGFMTNENGVVYVTSDVTETDNRFVAEYGGHTKDWWTQSDSLRLLESSKFSQKLYPGSKESNPLNTSILRVIGLIVLILAGLFFAISRVLRTYPGSNTTVGELFSISISPFSRDIKTLFVYMISLVAITSVIFLIASVL